MKKSHCYAFLLLLICFSITTNVDAATATTSTSVKTQSQVEVEKRVREYFQDAPVMIEIARCESKFRQFTDAGNVLRGGSGGGMIGVFQFFESIHAPAAKSLGFDLTTLEGNLGYARHVYVTQGTTPWNSARTCWNVPITQPTKITSDTSRAALLAQIETLTKLISLLQKQLQLKQAKTI